MNIWQKYEDQIELFKEYLKYLKETKLSPTIDAQGNKRPDYIKSKVIVNDLLLIKIFYPQRPQNITTNALVDEIASKVAKCILEELQTKSKATHLYLSSSVDKGVYSWDNTTQEQHN